MADGCGWGTRPRDAAIKAAAAFHDYMRDNQKDIVDLRYFKTTIYPKQLLLIVVDPRDAGRLILRAFSKAHQRIIEGFDEVWEAGSTTLCAGVMLVSLMVSNQI